MHRISLCLYLMGIIGFGLWLVSPQTIAGQSGGFTLALPLASRTDSAPFDQIVGVYAADFDGDLDIYLNRGGVEETGLTNNNTHHDDSPQWSPDNELVLYRSYLTSTVPEQGNLYVVDIGGSEVLTLTQNTNTKTDWKWNAPSDISFLETQSNGQVDLFMVPTGAITATRLVTDVINTPVDWSSDGEQLAFTAAWDGDNEVYTITRDGITLTQITTNTVDDTVATWVKEDLQLVVRRVDGTEDNLWAVTADGSSESQLTTAARGETFDSVSPDSTLIAYIQEDISDGEPYRYMVVQDIEAGLTYPITSTVCFGADCHIGNSTWREDNRTLAWEIEGPILNSPGEKTILYSTLPYGSVENLYTFAPEQPFWLTDKLFHVINIVAPPNGELLQAGFAGWSGGNAVRFTNLGITVQFGEWRWLPDGLRP